MSATEVTTCPFCNARVSDSATKVTCPRCGESFANRSAGQTDFSSAVTADAPAPPPRTQPAGRNRLVLGIVLGAMALTAASGLTYALLTQDRRRGNDNEQVHRPRRQLP